MNFPLKLDASFLSSWSNCREQVRQSFVEERAPIIESPYYRNGTALHLGVQRFWEGKPYEVALADAFEVCNTYNVKAISTNLYLSKKWAEMQEQLPDSLACYFDNVEQDTDLVMRGADNEVMIENEWSMNYCIECNKPAAWFDERLDCGHPLMVILCGRIDRVMKGSNSRSCELPDIKTASEISNYGVPWKTGYQNGKMLEVQFGLYDYALSHMGWTPSRVYLEVLVKGYKSKPPRLEIIELPHVTIEAYRARFRQQLAWKVSEIVHYFRNYKEQKPWPMSGGSACKTVYGECEMLPLCISGPVPKVLELYQIRTEHLNIRKLDKVITDGA
jgi:hypothetical protein